MGTNARKRTEKERKRRKAEVAERAHKASEKEAEKVMKEQEKAEGVNMKARVEEEKTVKAFKKRSLMTSGRGNSLRQKRKRTNESARYGKKHKI